MKNRWYDALLKLSAFVVPFYFVYYGPLHDKPDNPEVKTLWRYVFSGFSLYLILFIVIGLVR